MVQEKKAVYCKALVELNEIIQHMSEELQSKIPQEIRQEFIRNMDKEYSFNYDETISLEEQNIMPETQGLLSVIYSNYLCSEEEKKKWKEYDRFYQYEQEKQGSIETKELFTRKAENQPKKILTENEQEQPKERNINTLPENTISQELAIIKEKNIFIKILKKLKSWFSKNKR